MVWTRQYSDEFAGIPTWRLLKAERSRVPVDGYVADPAIDEKASDLSVSYWNDVHDALLKLPGKLVAVQCDPLSVSWLGIEKVETTPEAFIVQLAAALDELAELNVATIKVETRE